MHLGRRGSNLRFVGSLPARKGGFQHSLTSAPRYTSASVAEVCLPHRIETNEWLAPYHGVHCSRVNCPLRDGAMEGCEGLMFGSKVERAFARSGRCASHLLRT